jgi:hypothetical protein
MGKGEGVEIGNFKGERVDVMRSCTEIVKKENFCMSAKPKLVESEIQ